MVNYSCLILAVGPCGSARADLAEWTAQGMRLIQVATAQDAVLWTREAHPDVVLIDPALNGSDPPGLARRCRRLNPSARVVVLDAETISAPSA